MSVAKLLLAVMEELGTEELVYLGIMPSVFSKFSAICSRNSDTARRGSSMRRLTTGLHYRFGTSSTRQNSMKGCRLLGRTGTDRTTDGRVTYPK